MVLEGANSSFGGVAAVYTGRDKLVVDVFGVEEGFECCGTFVVETVQLGAQTGSEEAGVKDSERLENASAGAAFHWLNEDTITVVIVYDKYVVVSSAGGDDKSASLIGMNLTGGGVADSCETVMRPGVVWIACGEDNVIAVDVDEGRGGCGVRRPQGFGRLLIFAGLIKVAFDHSNGLWWIFAKSFCGEALEVRHQVTAIEGCLKCRERRRKITRRVQMVGGRGCGYSSETVLGWWSGRVDEG